MTARRSRRPSRALLPSRVPGHHWVQQWCPHRQKVHLSLYPSGELDAVGFVVDNPCCGDELRWFVSDDVVAKGAFVRTRKAAMRFLEDRILQPRHRLWDQLDRVGPARSWRWWCTDPESLCGHCALAPPLSPDLASCARVDNAPVIYRGFCDELRAWPTLQRGCWTWGHPLPRAEAPATGFWQQAVRVDGNGTGAVRAYREVGLHRLELSEHERAVLVFGPPFGPGAPTNVQLHLRYRGYRILQTVKAQDESEA